MQENRQDCCKKEAINFITKRLIERVDAHKMRIGEDVFNNGCCSNSLNRLYDDAIILKKASNLLIEIGTEFLRSDYEN